MFTVKFVDTVGDFHTVDIPTYHYGLELNRYYNLGWKFVSEYLN